MRIAQSYPNFSDERAVLVVAGAQSGVIYRANQGDIIQVAEMKYEDPRYSDREGFFMTRQKGKTIRSGSVYESKSDVSMRACIADVVKNLRALEQEGFDSLYLYAPAYALSSFREALSPTCRSKLIMTFRGNYQDRHPFELLSELKNRLERRKSKRLAQPLPDDVKRLLDTSQMA